MEFLICCEFGVNFIRKNWKYMLTFIIRYIASGKDE